MKRKFSGQTVAVFALILAVFAAVFSWRAVQINLRTMELRAQELDLLKARQDDLDYTLLNMGSLLVREEDEPCTRILAADPALRRFCETVSRKPLMPAFQRGRAISFLAWYYIAAHTGKEMPNMKMAANVRPLAVRFPVTYTRLYSCLKSHIHVVHPVAAGRLS